MKTKLNKAVAIAALACLGNVTAQALTVLRISDGNTVINIGDNLAGDANAGDGIISFNGTFDGWQIGLTATSIKPLIFAPYQPDLNLNWTVTRLGPEAGKLRIEFTDTDFILRSVGMNTLSSLEGGLGDGGSASMRSYFDTGNQEFGETAPLTSGFFDNARTGSSLALEQENFIPGERRAQFLSFTLDMLLTVQPETTTSGGTQLHVPDGGSTLAMLGMALVAIGAASCRRKEFVLRTVKIRNNARTSELPRIR